MRLAGFLVEFYWRAAEYLCPLMFHVGLNLVAVISPFASVTPSPETLCLNGTLRICDSNLNHFSAIGDLRSAGESGDNRDCAAFDGVWEVQANRVAGTFDAVRPKCDLHLVLLPGDSVSISR